MPRHPNPNPDPNPDPNPNPNPNPNLGHAAPPLFDAIAAAATPRVAEFNAMELASLAWGFATAGHASRCPALFDAIAAAAAPKLDRFDTQALTPTLPLTLTLTPFLTLTPTLTPTPTGMGALGRGLLRRAQRPARRAQPLAGRGLG